MASDNHGAETQENATATQNQNEQETTSCGFGEVFPDGGAMNVMFDDSIIQDVAAEKAQDMPEVGVTLATWEYRAKVVWRGREDG